MKKGAIKVSVLYPNETGKTFDMDYYCNKHVPMVAGLLGDAVIGATVESGLGGGAPNEAATYIAMGNLYFETIEAFETSFGPNTEQIMGDLPNYTTIEPVIQISEVMI
ncbi:EthD family reductase [Thalassobellus citreus]|uniref:EthD family reductase n=1 Tax=Thalassobellus citreus TaxID=3367752 RepID=UPI00379F3D77